MNETWKPIPGFEGVYEVSSLGGVRSLDRQVWSNRGRGFWADVKGRTLKTSSDAVLHGTHPNSKKLACIKGHPFSPENTRMYGRSRVCRECDRESARLYQQRRRSALKAS